MGSINNINLLCHNSEGSESKNQNVGWATLESLIKRLLDPILKVSDSIDLGTMLRISFLTRLQVTVKHL